MRDYQNEVKEMRKWLRDEMKYRGFNKVVLGLSGGFDSALSAYVASHDDCLGKDGVFCVMMPCESSNNSVDDACNIIKYLDLKYRFVDLNDPFDSMIETLDFVYKDNMVKELKNLTSPVSKGNIKARLRMITLYAFSNSMNALVLNTSNKSEIYSGNGTKFGDGAGDIALFQNYTKTEMYELAKAIGFDKEFPVIFNKIPTADLEPNQTDEWTMGVTYSELDAYLNAKWEEDIMAMDKDVVERIQNLIGRSTHKREKMPSFKMC